MLDPAIQDDSRIGREIWQRLGSNWQHRITERAKALFARHPEIQKEIRCKQAFFRLNDMTPLAQTLGNTIRWRKHRWPPSYK